MLASTKFCIFFINNDSILQQRLMPLLDEDYKCHIAKSGEEGVSLYANDEELRRSIINVCNTLFAETRSKVQDEATIQSKRKNLSLEGLVREFIESYYAANGFLSEDADCNSVAMSEKLNLTHRTFQREIKKQSGYSFKQLHLQVRLEQARKMLASDHKVFEVADALGFSSPSHLSRAFKNQFGLAPTQYIHQ